MLLQFHADTSDIISVPDCSLGLSYGLKSKTGAHPVPDMGATPIMIARVDRPMTMYRVWKATATRSLYEVRFLIVLLRSFMTLI